MSLIRRPSFFPASLVLLTFLITQPALALPIPFTYDWDGARVAKTVNEVTTSYYHQDALGSVVALTDSTGAVISTYAYEPFGAIRTSSSSGPSVIPAKAGISFTGRPLDPESGLLFLRNRYYDPRIGRFLTPDPIGISGGINLYGYVRNNPINWKDPWGLDVMVLNDSDAVPTLFGPAGHSAVAVGNDTTGWDYFSQDGSVAGGNHIHYNSLNDLFAEQRRRYDRAYRIETAPQQDQRTRTFGQIYMDVPYNANPFSSCRYQCADLVNDVLRTGGVPNGVESFGNIPNVAYDSIRRENPRGKNK